MSRRVAALLSGLVAAAVVAAAGVSALSGGGREARPPDVRPLVLAATPSPAPTATATAARRRSRRPSRPARPVRVRIPSIGVDAPLVRLGLDGQGALEAPKGFEEAGWWSGGARPGERGPAVIAGHVDSKVGPAVFFELGRLHRGDAIVVGRSDGTSVRFTVEGSERYPKDRFPTQRVYGPTSRPALRLITCSGTFDRSTGHYLDNTVVYAAA